jgi:hypothetical protein
MNDPLQPIDPAVDDVVQQGAAIQDLFAQDDQQSTVPFAATTTDQPLPAMPSPPPPQPTPQKSPLDILEEILSKEEKKAEPEAVVPEGPTPEEIEAQNQLRAAELALLEEQRQKMMTETQSQEQQQRDAIRQQQVDSNKSNNPYEIIQLERKKVTR